MSWQKAQVVIDDGYDGPPMPSDEGTFCEHLVTCNCDWLDWAVILTFFIIVTSGFFMIVGATSEEGTKSNIFEIGAWIGGVVAFLGVSVSGFHSSHSIRLLGGREAEFFTHSDHQDIFALPAMMTNTATL